MQHLQPSTTLQGGKYRIERVLGQGGFGITYLAMQTSLRRHVAIKEFFMKDFCRRDEATLTMLTSSSGVGNQVELYRKKFIKEARNLAKLNHPNIISVIDVFEENGTVYYAMPYLAGGSLQNYVESRGTLSEAVAMKYVRQIASALKYMHEEKHICHYDVKPANILLDDKDNAVLIDFGISKNYDAAGNETTKTPVGLSEGYAPIEQYQQNLEEFSPASDVYALGATLYFLLHGKRPVSAVHRASGTALIMSMQLSQGIKDIINVSMRIPKSERAQSVDVFWGNISVPIKSQYNSAQNDNETTTIEKRKEVSGSSQTYASSPIDNNTNNSSLIGWIIGVTLLISWIAIVVFINYPGANENVEEVCDSAVVDTFEYIGIDNMVKQEEKRVVDWSGEYSAVKDAGGTYGGTPVSWETTFSLKRVNDTEYVGSMSISGYQTSYEPAKIRGYADGNRIRIYFVSCDDDEYGLNKWSTHCEKNTPLLSLAIENGAIDSEWYAALVETECVDQSTPVKKQR